MARATVLFALAIVAFSCLLLNVDATFDFGQYVDQQLQKTIQREHLTCDNYERFCHKSNQQFQVNGDPSTVEMSVTLCKVILKTYLCPDSENSIPE